MRCSAAPIVSTALALSVFACGRVLEFDESDDSMLRRSSDAGSAQVAFNDAAPPSNISPLNGTCTIYKLVPQSLGDSGVVIFGDTRVDGAAGSKALGGKRFTVACYDGSTELMRVTFGPYAALGDYTIAVGDLVLHGEPSDRVCKLSLSDASGMVRGFLSCPTAPYSESNIFSRSGPPIGLGAFDIPPLEDIPNDTGDCQAVSLVTQPLGDSGAPSYETTLVDGTAAMTSIGGQRFTVTCKSSNAELMRVTFGPFTKLGNHPIAVGDLIMGGQPSDRACSLSLSSVNSMIRGFVSCPTAPYSESNIFSRSGAPIGLAAFDVAPPK